MKVLKKSILMAHPPELFLFFHGIAWRKHLPSDWKMNGGRFYPECSVNEKADLWMCKMLYTSWGLECKESVLYRSFEKNFLLL